MLGLLGHLFIVIAFVTVSAAIFAYYQQSKADFEIDKHSWQQFARCSFYIHGLAVLAAVTSLFIILFQHRYDFDYAWQHVANDLPFYFIISAFWEGQEGSFLLWIFWNVIIGWRLLKVSHHWEAKNMMIFCAIQLFLLSMVLGIHVLDNLQLGNSPFLLLKDVSTSDVFKSNPNFVPTDGTGLNPLLQNIWMVIHPPIIFLGYALSGVPFTLAMAAFWEKEPEVFVYKSSPWLLASVGILGVGIVMGAYWAYETLNFGGYWNWDPVENAVFVPWLAMLGAIHGSTLYRRKGKGLLHTMILAMAGFILVVYATFLTRSGILGNSSVHAFTDLGLSGQLLFFLLSFVFAATAMLIYGKKQIKESDSTTSFLSLEFWMMLGICLFCLSAFQILLPTSIPVINVIMEAMGMDKNMAPPADQVQFYSCFQIWFGIAFCLAAALGQVLYWKKIQTKKMLENELLIPVVITLVVSAVIILISRTRNISYILLIVSAVYLMATCIQLLLPLVKSIKRTSLGGLLAHVGMAIMLMGFVYSAGKQKILSKNLSVNSTKEDLPPHTVQKSLLLNQNVPKENNGYSMTYLGTYYKDRDSGNLIPTDQTLPTWEENKKIYKGPKNDEIGYGDTLRIEPENIYYSVEISDGNHPSFIITPRMQNNPSMGYIASPAIKSRLTGDIYTHVTNFPDPEKIKWNAPERQVLSLGETIDVQGLQLTLKDIRPAEDPLGIPSSKNDFALEATVLVEDQYGSYLAKPIYHVSQNRALRLFPDQIEALGTKVILSNVDPAGQKYELTVLTSQRNWITIECIEMPMIGLVWFGAILLTLGTTVSFYFRLRESIGWQPKLARLPPVSKQEPNPLDALMIDETSLHT